MWVKVRNAVTLVVGIAGGIYLGENLPECYYDPISQYLPKVEFLQAHNQAQV